MSLFLLPWPHHPPLLHPYCGKLLQKQDKRVSSYVLITIANTVVMNQVMSNSSCRTYTDSLLPEKYWLSNTVEVFGNSALRLKQTFNRFLRSWSLNSESFCHFFSYQRRLLCDCSFRLNRGFVNIYQKRQK